MKRTVDYGELQLWRDAARLRSDVRSDVLLAARFEPIVRDLIGYGTVDLSFTDGASFCVVPNVVIDPMHLTLRQSSPFLWPEHVALAVDADALAAIEARVTPWLRMLARGRPLSQEEIRLYGDSAVFARARALQLAGAVPLAVTVPRLAPFVYAARFADGARVRIRCDDAADAAAVLRWRAAQLDEPVPQTDDARFARAWYGLPEPASFVGLASIVVGARASDIEPGARLCVITGEPLDSIANALSVVVPQPVPLDVMFTFDEADAPPVRRFDVVAHALPPMRAIRGQADAPGTGGSAGTIVLGLREDALLSPDADTDAANELARRLRAEGLTVNVTGDPMAQAIAEADLVHIFGGYADSHIAAFAERAERAGIPYVLALEPVTDWSTWTETTLPIALRAGIDDEAIERLLVAYEARTLLVDDAPVTIPDDDVARVHASFERISQRAAALVVPSGADAARLRQRVPGIPIERVVIAGPVLAAEPHEDDIASRIPDRPFVLMHAPIATRSNLLFALWALRRSGIPIVIAGDGYDVNMLMHVNHLGGEHTIVVLDPTAGTLAALYRRAALWLDPMPHPRGIGRFMRAAGCGVLPIVPRSSPLAGLVESDAPTYEMPVFGSLVAAVHAGLDAPDRTILAAKIANRNAPLVDVNGAFGAIVGAYARVGNPA